MSNKKQGKAEKKRCSHKPWPRESYATKIKCERHAKLSKLNVTSYMFVVVKKKDLDSLLVVFFEFGGL